MTWTLKRLSRAVRWTDADGNVRELQPGDSIPDEALALCPKDRLEIWVGGGTGGGRVIGSVSPAPAETPPEPEPAAEAETEAPE